MKIYNTLSKKLEVFKPMDDKHVRMYVCGATVYDRPHIGNARPAVVFDVLFRVLQALYPKVTYARNITDIDDKIINAAKERDVTIGKVTSLALSQYQADMSDLNVLDPTYQPKATEYVEQMCRIIKVLLEKDKAYIAPNGDVMFDVKQFETYGSFMDVENLEAGSRIEADESKRNAMDFVLWKNIEGDDLQEALRLDYAWKTPDYMSHSEKAYGRPGWHLECTAMSTSLLGELFDIHGGGLDLTFPHHENERAQTCAYSGKHDCANYWMHNGLIQFTGGKMSKSLGNIVYLDEAGQSAHPLSVRFFFLQTHYRHPLDWSVEGLQKAHLRFTGLIKKLYALGAENEKSKLPKEAMAALQQDLNTSLAITELENYIKTNDLASALGTMELLGLMPQGGLLAWLQRRKLTVEEEELMQLRMEYKNKQDYEQADKIRVELLDKGLVIEDSAEGYFWHVR